jgi:predicted enzyme related to lactoylglutathione lyase
MDRLRYVVLFTADVPGMKRFYETRVGLATRRNTPAWIEFDTGGATLALLAVPDPAQRGIQLRFATDDLDARARELAARGAELDPPGVAAFGWGKMASLRDPEGNPLMLMQAAAPEAAGNGLGLSAVVNCRDLPAVKAYYRDVLGFATTHDTPWWVQLSAGEAGLGLHPRATQPGAETHHGGAVTVGLAIPDLVTWAEEASERGLEFTAPPADRGYGVFADAVDPDGHAITFRDLPEPETLEEQLAEPFEEDDAAPHRAAIRKPVKKRVTAGSRLSLKPAHAAKKASRPRASGSKAGVVSPRGTGPAGARQKPKRRHDTKRARAKPAIGRLRKAERRTLARKKVAVATAGKSKPVKRAATRASRGKPARRASGRTRR